MNETFFYPMQEKILLLNFADFVVILSFVNGLLPGCMKEFSIVVLAYFLV